MDSVNSNTIFQLKISKPFLEVTYRIKIPGSLLVSNFCFCCCKFVVTMIYFALCCNIFMQFLFHRLLWCTGEHTQRNHSNICIYFQAQRCMYCNILSLFYIYIWCSCLLQGKIEQQRRLIQLENVNHIAYSTSFQDFILARDNTPPG